MPRRGSSTEARVFENDGTKGSVDGDHDADDRKAVELVRLALFAECRRTSLKREEIVKKVLGSNGRAFNQTLEQAQHILRSTFGMELVELLSKSERDANEKANDDKTTGKKKGASSKTYILRSTLDSRLIYTSNQPDNEIQAEESRTGAHSEDDEFRVSSDGSILAWQTSDHLGSFGLLSVVLALILVNGKELPDMQLRGYLKTLRLPPNTDVPFSSDAILPPKTLSIDAYLSNMTKHGYLDRTKRNIPHPSASQQPHNKRSRQSKAGENDGDVSYMWKWGLRALAEIGETAISNFVTSFMLEKKTIDRNADDEEQGQSSDGRQQQRDRLAMDEETMKKSILKAAGSRLV